MLFNSWIFLGFFLIFYPVFLIFRGNVFYRNALLLLGSYFFYGWWDWRFLILVAISTAVDYCSALGAAGKEVLVRDIFKAAAFMAVTTLVAVFLAKKDYWLILAVAVSLLAWFLIVLAIRTMPQESQRKPWLFLSIFVNIGILGFFKYFEFFVTSLSGFLDVFGFHQNITTLHIILPVGLSFYTFQAISRTTDSYLGKFDPQRSIVNYAAYHAFFPQLVAGPIERASHLMPQFERVLPLVGKALQLGILLFLWGLVKKIVIADNLAILVDPIFSRPELYSGGQYLLAVIGFTFQIYCDFSGYSDMARGLAALLGFSLMANFNLPYFSRSPSEFWRRWHISLSQWLRDYVYIPLGGNRQGTQRTYGNLMITMLVGGLWHGAAWTFVVWGAIHGAIQVFFLRTGLERLVHPKNGGATAMLFQLGGWALTMIAVMIAWILFRANSFAQAWTIFVGSLIFDNLPAADFGKLAMYVGPLFLVEAAMRLREATGSTTESNFFLRYTACLALLLVALSQAAGVSQQFIYFDF